MPSFILSQIPEIRFGAGRIADLASVATSLAGKQATVLMVADPVLSGIGITARALEILSSAGMETHLFDALNGEPKAADIDAAAAMARDRKCRAIVGLGGGSALDTAKLVACCATTGKPAESYQLAQTPLPKNRLPVIAVPTTAGTGSEVTRVSVFANAAGKKVWAWGEELKPDLALLDPELTLAVPPQVTAATGLDALVHAIEACTNRHRNAGNDLYCHKAISLITVHLPRVLAQPGDVAARGAVLLGACYGGIGIDNCGTALAHNISHALANLAHIPHGRATGLAMLATIAWVAEGAPDAFAAVAKAMGEADAISGYEKLVRATGLKISLAGDGFELNRPERLAEQMALPANEPMRKSTVRYPAETDLLMLAERVYALS